MGIFKHTPADVKSPTPAPASATAVAEPQSEKARKLAPPFIPPNAAPRSAAAAGVVPPPTTPIYSMHPADAPPLPEDEGEIESAKAPVAPRAQRSSPTRAAMTNAPRTDAVSRPAPQWHSFDPVAATQAGMLNLAWKWQEAGAPIRAIHTYVELLVRYPHTPGADAAVADLVELSNILAQQGQFHTALAIYDHLEALLS